MKRLSFLVGILSMFGAATGCDSGKPSETTSAAEDEDEDDGDSTGSEEGSEDSASQTSDGEDETSDSTTGTSTSTSTTTSTSSGSTSSGTTSTSTGEVTTSTTSAGTSSTSTTGDPTSDTEVYTPPATWATVTQVFSARCSGAGCHDYEVEPVFGGSNPDVHGTLLHHTSEACGGVPVVVPGDPDNSALMMLLEGPCGTVPQMPNGCRAEEGTCLPQEFPEYVEAIRQWIADGALM